ncbi:hypothetical protein HAX54_052157, partial [Datura stramonium]|nr:hypothetical protein [Datura stramonium]
IPASCLESDRMNFCGVTIIPKKIPRYLAAGSIPTELVSRNSADKSSCYRAK